MRNANIEALIPKAVDVLAIEVADKKSKKVKKPYKGYYASFGASVIQSGLLPAVIFFSQVDSGAEASRWKVPYTIYRLMFPDQQEKGKKKQAVLLRNYLLKQQVSHANVIPEEVIQQVLEAALALKMALRTFETT